MNINCLECGKKFCSKISLKYHERQHADKSKFYCFKCEHFIASDSFEEHISTMKCVRRDSYICKKCGKGYVNKKHLEVHESIHEEVRRFHCQHCSKSFHQKGNLNTHQKRKHG